MNDNVTGNFRDGEPVRVLKETPQGRALVDGTFCEHQTVAACKLAVRLPTGEFIYPDRNQIFSVHTPIKFEKGALLITSERGSLRFHGPLMTDEEARLVEMWHGKLGLTVIARVDLEKNPITLREGQGLDIEGITAP